MIKVLKKFNFLRFFKKVKLISDTEWLDITNESFYDLTDNGFLVELFTPGGDYMNSDKIFRDNVNVNTLSLPSFGEGYPGYFSDKVYFIVIKSNEPYQLSEVLPTIKHTLNYLSEYKFKLRKIYYQEFQNKQTGLKIIQREWGNISKVCPNVKTRSVQIKLNRI